MNDRRLGGRMLPLLSSLRLAVVTMVTLGAVCGYATFYEMQHGTPATAHLFIINPFSGGGMAKLFSTHPPTEERIARLEQTAVVVAVRIDETGRQRQATGVHDLFPRNRFELADGGDPVAFQAHRALATWRTGTVDDPGIDDDRSCRINLGFRGGAQDDAQDGAQKHAKEQWHGIIQG